MTTEKPHPLPETGGVYNRDKKTGQLSKKAAPKAAQKPVKKETK